MASRSSSNCAVSNVAFPSSFQMCAELPTVLVQYVTSAAVLYLYCLPAMIQLAWTTPRTADCHVHGLVNQSSYSPGSRTAVLGMLVVPQQMSTPACTFDRLRYNRKLNYCHCPILTSCPRSPWSRRKSLEDSSRPNDNDARAGRVRSSTALASPSVPACSDAVTAAAHPCVTTSDVFTL